LANFIETRVRLRLEDLGHDNGSQHTITIREVSSIVKKVKISSIIR